MLVPIFFCFISLCLGGGTVGDKINERGCSSQAVAGLSRQLVLELNSVLGREVMVDLNTLRNVQMTSSTAAVPYLQKPAALALQKVVNDAGRTMTINSGLRSLAQQLLLWSWQGGCGITVAAAPGQSNHNGGLAVDISDADSWVSAMSRRGWAKLGDWDPPHYDFTSGGEDIRSSSVLAFQRLWNRNNPNSRIPEDGAYGPGTESALKRSPADGFPIGPTASSSSSNAPTGPGPCENCIKFGGGAGCLKVCTGCPAACTECVRLSGGKACASRCPDSCGTSNSGSRQAEEQESGSSGPNVGLIVGVTIGAVVLLTIVLVAGFLLYRSKQNGTETP